VVWVVSLVARTAFVLLFGRSGGCHTIFPSIEGAEALSPPEEVVLGGVVVGTTDLRQHIYTPADAPKVVDAELCRWETSRHGRRAWHRPGAELGRGFTSNGRANTVQFSISKLSKFSDGPTERS